uniref:Intraflagellar transport protein 57 homolog n=1 Tax=Clastoptera arizonana TaxID=38151 RepID=A0A1B6D1U8_9HEMI
MSQEILREGSGEDLNDSQGKYQPFIMMNELLDKLKILNYDDEFSKSLKMRPLNRFYFSLQTNPGEQFFMFTSLAAWLVRKIGLKFEQPQEYDDPNSTIASILDATRDLGIVVDFPPNKLKQGSGKFAVYILNCLADKAMDHVKWTWKKPQPPIEVDIEESIIEDDAELLLEKIEEEMATEDTDDDEDNLLNIDDLQNITNINKSLLEVQKPDDVLESNTNNEEWKLELERVMPMLKVTVKTESSDWRTRLEQMKVYRNEMQEIIEPVKTQLNKLENEISTDLNKIQNREKFLNNHLESLLVVHRNIQSELAKVMEQYKDVNGGVTERQRLLNQLTDSLEATKQEMEERGSSMTDGSPLVNIKKAVTRIKSDISAMNVRIGVLQHCILQTRLKDKDFIQSEFNSIQ